MKNPASMAQPDLRPYTRTFFRGNRLNFALALTDVLLSAAANLLISWLLQWPGRLSPVCFPTFSSPAF